MLFPLYCILVCNRVAALFNDGSVRQVDDSEVIICVAKASEQFAFVQKGWGSHLGSFPGDRRADQDLSSALFFCCIFPNNNYKTTTDIYIRDYSSTCLIVNRRCRERGNKHVL